MNFNRMVLFHRVLDCWCKIEISIPIMCPHPPQLAVLPDGFTSKQFDPVPDMSTTPPDSVAVASEPWQSLHMWNDLTSGCCFWMEFIMYVLLSSFSTPLNDIPNASIGVSSARLTLVFASSINLHIRVQHSSIPERKRKNCSLPITEKDYSFTHLPYWAFKSKISYYCRKHTKLVLLHATCLLCI